MFIFTQQILFVCVIFTQILIERCEGVNVLTPASVNAPQNFADIIEPLLPSVVSISTATNLRNDTRGDLASPQNITIDDLLRQFVEDQNGPSHNRARKTLSLGSGFIISQEGNTAYIVTCAHVIDNVDEINVTLNDDVTTFKGQVVGRDQRTDLALIKIKTTKNLVPARWGSSNKLRIGEYIIAIGNAYGLSSTVTVGIISTISRDIGRDLTSNSADYVQGYIQTDASINRGNSGGPMFNTDGQVIAISRVIFSPNGGSIGIGFGIPSNQAQVVIEQLKKFGHTKRGWIGILIRPFTLEDAESLGLKENVGAFINDVTPNGPAQIAGLQSGDLVLTFDQTKVKDSRHLQYLVGDAPINSQHKIKVWRAGKDIFLTLKISEYEKAHEMGLTETNSHAQNSQRMNRGQRVMGMVLKEITAAVPDYSRLNIKNGLLIEFVEPDSDADLKGIMRGAVILEAISGKTIVKLNTVAELKEIIANAKNHNKKSIMLQVKNGDTKIYVSITIQ